MRQREKDRIRNRRLFLDSAERLFEEKGYLNSTIEAIADRAGFSKATVYNYFGGKDHLLAELIQEKFRDLHEKADLVFADDIGFREGIDRYIGLSLGLIQENMKLFRIMMTEGFKSPEIVEDIIHPNVFHGLRQTYSKLIDFIEKNSEVIDPRFNPRDLAFFLMSIIGGYASPICIIADNFDLSTKKDELVEMFLGGALKKQENPPLK